MNFGPWKDVKKRPGEESDSAPRKSESGHLETILVFPTVHDMVDVFLGKQLTMFLGLTKVCSGTFQGHLSIIIDTVVDS